MVTRADVEALIARAMYGEAGVPHAPSAPASAWSVDSDEWRELTPISQRVYQRLRAIERSARATGGEIGDEDARWMARDTGETREERERRLVLMWRERGRA